jgi:hypothetical protein
MCAKQMKAEGRLRSSAVVATGDEQLARIALRASASIWLAGGGKVRHGAAARRNLSLDGGNRPRHFRCLYTGDGPSPR